MYDTRIPEGTIDLIISGDPVWCYTLNYKTGKVKERRGKITRMNYPSVLFKDDADPCKWSDWTLNSPSMYMGKVFGATVWFDHPNYEGAVLAFKNAGRRMAGEYSLKAKRSWNRYVQLQEVF